MNSQARKKAIIKGPGRYRLEFPGGLRVIEYKSQTFFQMSWAQYGQDVYLYHLLKERNNGFFVEAGAFDGEKFSNTLYLEIMRNWEGVLVEPNPYIFKDLVSKGRKSYMLNACLGNDTKLEFLLGNWLTSAHKVLNDEHKDRIDSITLYNEENYKSLRQKQHDGENVTVFCYSLFEILNSVGRSHVDFFSLDVEGAELYILQSLDWDKLTIDVFAVETYYNREKIMDFLIKKGYKWVHKIELDDFFIRTDLIL
ncbi:uncharacterized protein LOC128226241 [Mya arenaria]|uniref:uncharacterized protein LOC128226241 n=1 Tax=Mya arenaria TaxID=6604 RepID=UPI0022E48A43|nr:uncharacterized protein LOC128226241 [Mya arenaria]